MQNKKVEISSKLVRDFWRAAECDFDVKSFDKNDSDLMGIVSMSLEVLGILDKEAFMSNYTTTIGTEIYRPFEIGVPTERWPLVAQVIVCAHEVAHTIQYRDDRMKFLLSYLASQSIRAEYEANALIVNLEMHVFFYGDLPHIREMADSMSNYGLDAAHCAYVESVLNSVSATVMQGATVSAVSAWALDWLELNGVSGHVPKLSDIN